MFEASVSRPLDWDWPSAAAGANATIVYELLKNPPPHQQKKYSSL